MKKQYFAHVHGDGEEVVSAVSEDNVVQDTSENDQPDSSTLWVILRPKHKMLQPKENHL